ncbi:MAG: hypothetical protein IK102_06440 [Treponema sp.]|nr:hypothetical protein [Treponema sp.]
MKKSFILVISILLAACTFLTGCNTIKAVPLAYSVNEDVEVAYIYFELYKKNEISGATFVTYDNKSTPKPEKLTYWSPVEVPANTPIKLTLKVLYKEDRTEFSSDDCFAACCQTTINAFEASRDVNKEITFNVPPLEPDCEYTISYRKGPGFPGNSYVTLTRNDTKEVIRELEFN